MTNPTAARGLTALWRNQVAEWRMMFQRQSLQADLMAGLVTALVALPLCLALAVASGMTAQAGLITAALSGFVAGMFGSSRFSVTGPTAAMVVVLAGITSTYGPAGATLVALIVGVLQLVTGGLRLGRVLTVIPMPVITGFTTGIGLLILALQTPTIVGLEEASGEPMEKLWHVLQHLGHAHPPELLVFGMSILAAVIVPRFWSKVPGALPAVLVGTATALTLLYGFGIHTAKIGHIPSALPIPTLPDLSLFSLPLFTAALTVYALGSIEAVLCSMVCDTMTNGRHDPNQELVGQGLANGAVALFAGFPVTGAIVRSATGIRAGARTRLSPVFHAILLMVVLLVAAPAAAHIPMAALAAILVMTGIRMVEWREIRHLLKADRMEGAVAIVACIGTVVVDLVIGVGAGLAAAVLVFVWRAGHLDMQAGVTTTAAADGETLAVYHLVGPLYFGVSSHFASSFDDLLGPGHLVLDFNEVYFVDSSGVAALNDVAHRLHQRGITLVITGIDTSVRAQLVRWGAESLLADDRSYDDVPSALSQIGPAAPAPSGA